MSLLTMTDCTVEANRVQARYELDRAMLASGYAQTSSWAVKWGRPLLDAVAELPDEDTVAYELQEAQNEATLAGEYSSSLKNSIERTIADLDKIEASDQIRAAIDAIIGNLEKSL